MLHFGDSVRALGPLRAHSAFPFEDTNGELFHGSRDPQQQVCIDVSRHVNVQSYSVCAHIQIVKAFTERQRLSAAVEVVLKDDREDQRAKDVLSSMMCTGQRYMYTCGGWRG